MLPPNILLGSNPVGNPGPVSPVPGPDQPPMPVSSPNGPPPPAPQKQQKPKKSKAHKHTKKAEFCYNKYAGLVPPPAPIPNAIPKMKAKPAGVANNSAEAAQSKRLKQTFKSDKHMGQLKRAEVNAFPKETKGAPQETLLKLFKNIRGIKI